ncbi:brachyurin-like [Euwallacea similis]|uniref:brachyurin-like n=1 Tax=Euwallacea similis TaxID=1736056 RepID=UPI00344F8CBF
MGKFTGCSIFLLTIHLVFASVSREWIDKIVKNAKPGHMELDPRYGNIFDTAFFQNYNDSGLRIGGGGWESEPNSRPYQVGIYVTTSTGSSFCGGTLISSKTILTAAHCLYLSNGNPIIIYIGAHNMPPSKEEDIEEVLGHLFTLHPDWNPSTLQNDIGLIHLFETIQETETVKFIPLASDPSINYLGEEGLVIGWGLPGDDHTSASPVLRETTNRIISNLACRLAYMGHVVATNICMSGEKKKSTCRGDSGGPLIVDGVQVGITSFGTSAGCEVGWPPAFTRVSFYIEWINENKD